MKIQLSHFYKLSLLRKIAVISLVYFWLSAVIRLFFNPFAIAFINLPTVAGLAISILAYYLSNFLKTNHSWVFVIAYLISFLVCIIAMFAGIADVNYLNL